MINERQNILKTSLTHDGLVETPLLVVGVSSLGSLGIPGLWWFGCGR